jgi:hypothetical protein
MHVVDQQNTCLAIALSKPHQHIVLDRLDEPLTRQVHHLVGLSSVDRLLANRLHQVRLS